MPTSDDIRSGDADPRSGAASDDHAIPAIWPRSSAARYQPRSRLYQAMDVAQRIIDTPQDPWARAETPRREQLVTGMELFPSAAGNGVEVTARGATATRASQAPDLRLESPWQETVAAGADHTEPSERWKAVIAEDRPAAEATARPATPGPPSEPQAPSEPDDFRLVVDLRRRDEATAPALPVTGDDGNYGLGRRWGLQWRDAAQGWVEIEPGKAIWRPVVSTTETLANWDVDTYLGVVTAEVAVTIRGGELGRLGESLAHGRAVGISGLVEEAVERGAHAVVGVAMSYTPVDGRLLVTVTGTAVTLREKTEG